VITHIVSVCIFFNVNVNRKILPAIYIEAKRRLRLLKIKVSI
jgi:hypothetical protein